MPERAKELEPTDLQPGGLREVTTLALPIMLAEFTLGRGARKSPVLALAHYGGAAWKPLGWLFVAAGFLILAYYSVIAGWTVRYALVGLRDGFGGDASANFEAVATGLTAIVFHAGAADGARWA